MAVNIALIIDKAEAYVNFQKVKLLEDWGYEHADTKSISDVQEAGAASLFGDAPVSLITFQEKEDVQAAFEKLSKASEETLTRYGTPGLIMMTAVDRRSTAKLEKLVKSMGGVLVLAKEKSSDKTPVAKTLLNDLNLNREVKEFLADHAGDDYTSILGLIRTLSELSPAQQRNLSILDVAMRLPTPPGGVPPWEIERPLLAGNLTETIKIYRRISSTSHLLVPLKILSNKFKTSWKVSSILSVQPNTSQADLALALGVPNNYGLKLAMDQAKRYGEKKLQKILSDIAESEAMVKGASSANSDVIMEILLTKIHNTLRS